MREDLWQAIARLRRAQPRNPDTMAVCDALEEVLRYVRILPMRDKGTFDKKVYMREYMRKRRAEARARAKARKIDY